VDKPRNQKLRDYKKSKFNFNSRTLKEVKEEDKPKNTDAFADFKLK
jgi:hypothetical protein